MPFGFEADVLEVMLREVQGLHVKVILIESVLTHQEPYQKKKSQWVCSYPCACPLSAPPVHGTYQIRVPL
jgi:hypothetical protein